MVRLSQQQQQQCAEVRATCLRLPGSTRGTAARPRSPEHPLRAVDFWRVPKGPHCRVDGCRVHAAAVAKHDCHRGLGQRPAGFERRQQRSGALCRAAAELPAHFLRAQPQDVGRVRRGAGRVATLRQGGSRAGMVQHVALTSRAAAGGTAMPVPSAWSTHRSREHGASNKKSNSSAGSGCKPEGRSAGRCHAVTSHT